MLELANAFDQLWRFDGEHHFNTALEISRHPVGTRKVDLFLAALAEHQDAAVLQEPIDNAPHANVFGDAFQAGT